ncbi:hypothetical protein F6V25_07800 [Oryzomonas japonica]|uniref:Uncharacterized protein n=1 Tax=Oryzomonas japonica TaxID=2603858 RepID=A0A7J4ZRP3_9BACT|nr:hypothetical protein [Oryzomonas japonica]KAB0665617.1 hypothetical protein F6V25_07800 [Oryzomonas japonica]
MTVGTKTNNTEKTAIPGTIAGVVLSLTLAACHGNQAINEGNMYEKMGIYLLISLSIFAFFIVSFGGGKRRGKEMGSGADTGQPRAAYPLSATELTDYPVYVWDYRSSFHKAVFHPDGAFSTSPNVSVNGLDPTATAAGNWTLTPDGKLRITPRLAGKSRTYTCISPHDSAAGVLLQPDLGLVEVWYVGPNSLADIQISIFGISASFPATMRFSTAQVSGRTFYGATYPCLEVTSSGEVVTNHETTCGMIAFHEDGTLARSVDNKIGSVPDYAPSITGNWSVDDESGVLTMMVSGFRTTASILGPAPGNGGLIVGTTIENRLWFPDHEQVSATLAAYLSEAVRRIPTFLR